MKAITYNQFGNSSVLGINDVAEPTPGDGEVLIQVSHAGVNPVDWKIREGYLKDLLPHSFPIIPGWDVAGTVKSVGKGATNFAVGQEVYAYARKPTVQNGTYAEFVVLPENFFSKGAEDNVTCRGSRRSSCRANCVAGPFRPHEGNKRRYRSSTSWLRRSR